MLGGVAGNQTLDIDGLTTRGATYWMLHLHTLSYSVI